MFSPHSEELVFVPRDRSRQRWREPRITRQEVSTVKCFSSSIGNIANCRALIMLCGFRDASWMFV
jgi:hypothetical protein